MNLINECNFDFTTGNKHHDKAPEWMNQFFDKYTSKDNSEEKVMKKLASALHPQSKQCTCHTCGKVLSDNEVSFCQECVSKSIF